MKLKELALLTSDVDLKRRQAVIAHATYKSLDQDGDRMNRGMFDKSWRENRKQIRFFVNHDRNQAPGKVMNVWDDEDHAYTQVEFGTHTLGEDSLKMVDEGIMVGASFGFMPVKQKEIKGKGYDYFEAKHMETSILTHWGAHQDSGVVVVKKSFDPSATLAYIATAEKFCRNTTASDDAIKHIMKQLAQAKQLLIKETDTAISTDPSLLKCPKCATLSVGIEDEAGHVKCAECDHVLIKGNGQPDASSDESSVLVKQKLLLLKLKLASNG